MAIAATVELRVERLAASQNRHLPHHEIIVVVMILVLPQIVQTRRPSRLGPAGSLGSLLLLRPSRWFPCISILPPVKNNRKNPDPFDQTILRSQHLRTHQLISFSLST